MALTYLLLCSHPDHGGRLRDGIDMALAMGAFDLPLQLIFAGEAVLALQPGTVIFEAKAGPYRPLLSEELAPWAPAEGAPDAARYARQLGDLFLPA